ncbi:hypothetical protein QUD39_04945 [Staphylococcus hyicus]|uniref:hypothetical protein n=1 Tax=Staphylococcus hyicus TaxID=1284 RepID=UPI002739C89D|nr:hypothetical protein [Staphylococcus hyicus]MDP4460618.1 hypothetical protein [Staphylococcus hyicus]
MVTNRTPQDEYYRKSHKIDVFIIIMYVIFAGLSLIQGLTNCHILLVCTAVSVIIIFILEKSKDYYFNQGIYYRRLKLLDNAFNQLHEPKEATFEYYDNDEIEPGTYKLFWDVYESAFFSQFIVSKMLKIMYRLALIVIVFLLILFFMSGINIYSFFVLSLVFSNAFLNRINSFKTTNDSLDRLLEKSAVLADDMKNKGNNKEDFMRRIMDIIINYESTIAENKYSLSDIIYTKNKEFLNSEWESIKKKYHLVNNY